jgi:soluble lytic murein transglycosylase-like protein
MAYKWRTLSDGRVEIVGMGVPRLRDAAAARFERTLARWRSLILSQSRRTKVPASWLAAFIDAESAGDPRAVSPAGATGLLQLMPGWWRGHSAEEMKDPNTNATIGADLLAAIRRTQPQLPIVASVYNGGSDTATNAPRLRPGAPWGMLEDVGYISRVVAGNNYAIERSRELGKSSRSGAFPIVLIAAVLAWASASPNSGFLQ